MPAEDPVDGVVATLGRLKRHVAAVEVGDPNARDDLAVAIHLLMGAGDGYGVFFRTLDKEGIPEPAVPSFTGPIPEEVDGTPVAVGLRAVAPFDGADDLPLSDFLIQDAVRIAIPGIEPQQTWSRGRIAKRVRDKYGGHIDGSPPRWLQELRYFPAGDQWTFGAPG